MGITKYILLILIFCSCTGKGENEISAEQFLDSPMPGDSIENVLIKDISSGIFFNNESGFYILLAEKAIYFITKDENITKDKFMLHYIREDGTFNNLSFQFYTKEIQEFRSPVFQNLKIAKIERPMDNKYQKIRIGQYDSKGNIWMKILDVESISTNRLLRYDGEFHNN